MNRLWSAVFGAFAAAAVILGATPASAAASSGHERFDGFLIASGASGSRDVVASAVVARGVFNGVGRIVEVDNLAGDPDNVSRDDLVFAAGTIHLVSTTIGADFSIDPATCVFKVTLQQTGTNEGGTGIFANLRSTFRGTVKAHGVLQRDPDGSCSQDQAALLDVDAVSAAGTITL